jgi:hypothetical protein
LDFPTDLNSIGYARKVLVYKRKSGRILSYHPFPLSTPAGALTFAEYQLFTIEM